jgi:ubiquinone/menaquinone biosynthesis C-methylase UbiE
MFLSPEKIVEYCDVHHGMKVADFGSNIGTFSLLLAKRVGVHGVVYAIDVQKDLLTKLHNEAKFHKLENIEVIFGNLEKEKGTTLKDESVDRVFLVNTFFQIEDKNACIQEIRRVLKKGGKVIFIDWSDSFENLGPHKDSVIYAKQAEDIFERNYFKKEAGFPAGDHHYGILFIK